MFFSSSSWSLRHRIVLAPRATRGAAGDVFLLLGIDLSFS